MTTLQAPVDLSSATRVGPRVYRKQVLAKRTIDYPLPDGTTKQVTFDDDYLTDLANAYKAGAYDLVPFQLADGANRHNEDPRQYGGRVIGTSLDPRRDLRRCHRDRPSGNHRCVPSVSGSCGLSTIAARDV